MNCLTDIDATMKIHDSKQFDFQNAGTNYFVFASDALQKLEGMILKKTKQGLSIKFDVETTWISLIG